jgi:hypothetical protein
MRQARLGTGALGAALLLATGAAAMPPIPCSDIPLAQRYLDGLKPGPNTRAAQQHLDAAKRAHSEAECDKELRQVDLYARRSSAADKKAAPKRQTGAAADKRDAQQLQMRCAVSPAPGQGSADATANSTACSDPAR